MHLTVFAAATWIACALAAAGLALAQEGPVQAPMQLTSSAFQAGGEIPSKYTCAGKDVSPPLLWTNVPPTAKALALIVDDPDAPDPAAPKATWVHWVLFNLPATTKSLAEGAGNKAAAPPAVRGLNNWSKQGYGGPCPPVGRHRYFFKLYALDSDVGSLALPNKLALEKAMEGHVVAKAELIGTFQK